MISVALTTADGVQLSGSFIEGARKKAVLLLHMMPATKESWEPLVGPLTERGWSVLAIDLRGHGASAGGPDGYRSFLDEDHGRSIHDVEAAMAYLEGHGMPGERCAIVGASIGANLALCYAAEHPVSRLVLLSPGLNYRGVETLPAAARLTSRTAVLIATSEDDDENVAMSRRIAEELPPNVRRTVIEYHGAGHGTDMFGKEGPDLLRETCAWLA